MERGTRLSRCAIVVGALIGECHDMTDSRPLGDMRDVQCALNVGRSTLEKLLRTDPEFPAPMMIAEKRQWFLDEIEDYKATRPRRRYADNAA